MNWMVKGTLIALGGLGLGATLVMFNKGATKAVQSAGGSVSSGSSSGSSSVAAPPVGSMPNLANAVKMFFPGGSKDFDFQGKNSPYQRTLEMSAQPEPTMGILPGTIPSNPPASSSGNTSSGGLSGAIGSLLGGKSTQKKTSIKTGLSASKYRIGIN